ncbi:citrate/2-methylcitrate synthase [Roseibium sp.]|uniref:citrate/2-methylcitrate synthase n=1 Tax=Roseibium sp. TaxID=1936156 RepID=UPI003A96F140
MSSPIYLSAREAAAELGVQAATLYAYVSRGLIRSVPGPGKQRRYDAADVRRLMDRKSPGDEVGTSPSANDPILETRLTLITDEGHFYRGIPALELAATSSLEAVATLLWDCSDDPFASEFGPVLTDFPAGAGPLERLMAALAVWPTLDPSAYTLSPRLLRRKGGALLRLGVTALLGVPISSATVHEGIGAAWQVDPEVEGLLRAALVLSADHELNTSAFAVRCAASTRAPLHAALISGVGAFAGPRHGASIDRVNAWLSEIRDVEDVRIVLNARLQRGEPLPGFGHTIYSATDPRAACLLDLLASRRTSDPFIAVAREIVGTADELFGVGPNIDFALAVAQRALDLPPDAGKVLFCAGRMVGWIAHALEQYQARELIRPRAAYIGERPKGIRF